jgi:predicted nucleic-acid-binding protein
MRISVDTNILVRALMQDDPEQGEIAAALLKYERVAVSLVVLCEFAWVLGRCYKLERKEMAMAIRNLVDASNIQTHRTAVDAGLALLAAGGDFADGVIAFDSRWSGGECFFSFDKKAIKCLSNCGYEVSLATKANVPPGRGRRQPASS